MNKVATPVAIEKEKIATLKFPKAEVLASPKLIQQRKSTLERGATLGNGHRRKVKIIFEDHDGMKQVETTIWAATKSNVSLKGGIYIPVNRIHEVKLY